MQQPGYIDNALILSILLADDEEYRRESDYLMGLLDHTEAYQEQAAFLWLQRFEHKLRR